METLQALTAYYGSYDEDKANKFPSRADLPTPFISSIRCFTNSQHNHVKTFVLFVTRPYR